jgi:hypothetical protein
MEVRAGVNTLLFFDDLALNLRENLLRRIGKPELIEESVYLDPHANPAWGFPTVFRDPTSGLWRMAYGAWDEERRRYPLLAHSDDGLAWRPTPTPDSPWTVGRTYPHQAFVEKDFSEWPTCFVDDRAQADERIKGFSIRHPDKYNITTAMWVSADGLRWRPKPGVEWQRPGADPGTFVFRNDVHGCCTFTSRPDWTDRRIAVFETRDFLSYGTPELALQADALDEPLTEPYGMPVVPYKGMFVCLLWLYHTVPQVEGYSPHKFYGGHVDCQLAYSLDGRHFVRTLRDPLFGNGAPGEIDAGCVYPSSVVEQPDGSLRIYASASRLEHGYLEPGSGCLAAYRLRADGWVYLESRSGFGEIGTRPLYVSGDQLSVNLCCTDGEAHARLTDHEGKPVDGFGYGDNSPARGVDDTAWSPRWKGGGLERFVGKCVRLELRLRSARVYAISGSITKMTGGETWRLLNQGRPPVARPGF